MERRTARNWYWWLWLSPLLTVPTTVFLYYQDLGYRLVCERGSGGTLWATCDSYFAENISLILAVLVAALWHLVLLIPATNKDMPFVRWHGRQELALAGIRTVIPVLFVFGTGNVYDSLVSIPFLIVVWFGGTLWGQLQAARGKCTLANLAGRRDELAIYQPGMRLDEKEPDPEELIQIIKASSNRQERQMALARLKELGLVETL